MKKCKIYYVAMPDEWCKEQKLEWFAENSLALLPFECVLLNKQHNWINQSDNDFESLLPLATKEEKFAQQEEHGTSVFKLFTNGVVTNRDEWVYGFDPKGLERKAKFLVEGFNKSSEQDHLDEEIKWSDSLESKLKQGRRAKFDEEFIKTALFRPFVHRLFYADKIFSDRLTENHYAMFGNKLTGENKVINFLSVISSHPLAALAANKLTDLCLLKSGNGGTQCLPLYRYDSKGQRYDNITVWGLMQFCEHYNDNKITREDIFHYTYAVLHHPAYRRKYELNLKREFPRLPFHADFQQWAAWGKELMNLHINYETAKPFRLVRQDAGGNPTVREGAKGAQDTLAHARVSAAPRPKLKADKTSTKRSDRRMRPSPRSSTPTASPTTKSRSSISSSASARSALKPWRLQGRCRKDV